MSDSEKNPAAQATGKSLATLFATDPLELTSSDRQTIIEEFRKQRQEFLQREQQGKKSSSKKKSVSKKSPPKDLDLDLDVDIDI